MVCEMCTNYEVATRKTRTLLTTTAIGDELIHSLRARLAASAVVISECQAKLLATQAST